MRTVNVLEVRLDDDMDLKEQPAVQKAIWAAGRLRELEHAVAEYSNRRPFAVQKGSQGKKRVWELVFTEDVPVEIGFIAGDFFYNERASLDYMAAALVPLSVTKSSFFPILDERIWERPEAPDESQNVKTQRKRWGFVEKYMVPEVVDVMKQLQPISSHVAVSDPLPELMVLNRLSNADRHRKLTVARRSVVMKGNLSRYEYADGHEVQLAEDSTSRRPAYCEHAAIAHVPSDVTAVHLGGEVRLLFKAGEHFVDIADLRLVHEWVIGAIGALIGAADKNTDA
jgi:hypothetical protein